MLWDSEITHRLYRVFCFRFQPIFLKAIIVDEVSDKSIALNKCI
jgi:hypothetical protein